MNYAKSIKRIRLFTCTICNNFTLSRQYIHARVLTILLLIMVGYPMMSQAASNGSAATYVRPYGPKAPWNRPVKDLPIHSQSQKYQELLWEDATSSKAEGNFNLTFEGYTYPVYETNEATTEYRVIAKSIWGNMHNKMIPWNPSWFGASGSDGQVIILDPTTGREWNLWQVSVDTSSEVVEISNGNLVQAGIESGDGNDPGDCRIKENGFKGSRGIGIQYLAMLVRPEEVEKGVIEHALSMPISITDGLEYVAPATKLEHPDNPPGIPEGTRFALDITNQEIEEWIQSLPQELPEATRRAARIIAVALRDYGWFITDTTGGDPFFQFEDRLTAPEWEDLGLGYLWLNWKEYPRDLLDGLITKNQIYTLVPSDQYDTTLPTNQPPIAVITSVFSSELSPLTVHFDGSGSTDSDGEVVSYAWNFGDGSSSSEISPSHTFETEGSYTVKLTVTDDEDDSHETTENIVVKTTPPSNQLPVAMNDRYEIDEDNVLQVSAPGVLKNDSDLDDDMLQAELLTAPLHGLLSLNFDGSFTYVPDVNFFGNDSFTYNVNDGKESNASATVNLTVISANDTPVAVITKDRISGETPLTITFDATKSMDEDGTLVDWRWDFGDGRNASGKTVDHTFENPGTYTVVLEVVDNAGAKDSSSVTITVKESLNIGPPSDLNSRVKQSAVILTWVDNSSNEEGFYIERGIRRKGKKKIQYVRVAEISANKQTFSESLRSGTYFYRVQAFSSSTGNVSTYSNRTQVIVRELLTPDGHRKRR